MAAEQVWGLDRCSGQDNAFAVVFMKPQPGRNFGSHLAFGHEGANAALGFADPGYGLGFGTCRAAAKKAGPAAGPSGCPRRAAGRPRRVLTGPLQAPAAPQQVRPFVAAATRP